MSGEGAFTAADAIDLLRWKHSIFDLYAGIRASDDPPSAWRHWRQTRDSMYREDTSRRSPQTAAPVPPG